MEDLEVELVGGEASFKALLSEVAQEYLTSFASEVMQAEELFNVAADLNFSADLGSGRIVRLTLDKPVSANQ